MKKFNIKTIFFGIVLMLVISLNFGLSQVFSNDFSYISNAENISVSSGWTDNTDGTYSASLSKYGRDTLSMTVTVTGKGLFKYNYKNESGVLTVTYNNATVLNSSSSSDWQQGEITLVNDSNEITFNCARSSYFYSAKVHAGNFSLDVTTYTVNATANKPELGSVQFTNGSYLAGTNLSVVATPNENVLFLGFIDKDYNLLSSNTTYSFTAQKDDNITALFETVEGENTVSNPLNFNSLVTTIDSYCAENSSFSYNVVNNLPCNKYYIIENQNFSLLKDGVTLTAENGVYTFDMQNGQNVVLTFQIGTKQFLYNISNAGLGSISQGFGTTQSPYLITTEQNLQDISKSLSSVYKIVNDIYITKDFTPLGTSSVPFSGTLLGNNKTIYDFKTTSGDYRGLFAYTSGGNISDLNMENINITVGSYSAFLIGNAENGTNVKNVCLKGSLISSGVNIGGLVGKTSTKDGIIVSDSEVYGSISTTAKGNIGGLTGLGGTFTNCVVYASVSGVMTVGGLIGGHDATLSDLDKAIGTKTNSSFTNCYIAGEVALIGQHTNNYPYWGLINGYGAWLIMNLSNTGQRISVNYTSSVGVEEIKIFGNNSNPDGIAVTPEQKGNKYSFVQDISLTKTYVGSKLSANDLLSETAVNGITGNYGGFTIRFKMADGTFKYLPTLNRKLGRFESNFDLNLDTLTSYVDNFSNIEINQSKGTGTYTTSSGISIWGSAKINNANDFEHLSWVVNGAIPTTFKNGLYYNARSITTVGVDFQNDIDLTSLRYAKIVDGSVQIITQDQYNNDSTNAFVLNTDNNLPSGNIVYEFYGLGKSEMYPYRGSLYGNYHNLTVNMDFPESYLMGIIACATDQENPVVIENLTINGVINGRHRVGVVGMNDNYERSGSLVFTNVTNNADITAQSQVGGLIGEAHGAAVIQITNCTNNGNITATNGDAGGLVGTLTQHTTYAEVTITDSTNNGNVTASNIAGGLVATTAKDVHLNGTITNSGIISSDSGKDNQYVGYFKSGSYDQAEGSVLKTLYTLNLGVANSEFVINGQTYTTDENGNVQVEFLNQENLDNVIIEVESPLLKDKITISADQTVMESNVVVPVSIAFDESNVYDTTNDSWTLKAVVTLSDDSTLTIDITPNLTETQLNSNQLIFVNVGFTNDEYTIPSTLVATLKRITSGVKDYVTTAKQLLDKTSGTNDEFLTLGTQVKSKFDTLKQQLLSFSQDDVARFNNYISNVITNDININVGENVIINYFDNIVSSSDIDSVLQNLSVDYGNYQVNKNLTFTMLSGKSVTKEIVYTFEKNGTLNVTANTEGVNFDVNGITTFSFDEQRNITINKITLSVEFEKVEYVFDNTAKTINVNLNVLQGDDITYTLLYNQKDSAVNVGEYEVTVQNISGTDAIFYNLPTQYTKGLLKITPVVLQLQVQNNQTFTYNKNNQATDFSLIKLSESSYELNNNDYSANYSNDKYNSSVKPINAGEYKAVISVGSNFTINGSNEFSFTINKKQITDIAFDNTFVYSKQNPTFEFNNFEGLIDGDEISVTKSTIYDQKGQTSDGVNYGSYTVMINELSNDNYYVENLVKEFVVNKKQIEVTTGNLTSVYGDELVLDKLSYQVTSGEVYEGDQLNIKAKQLENTNSGDHIIYAEFTNDNYDVDFVNGTYTITQRELQIDFGKTDFVYNGQVQSLTPILTNVIEKDKESFVFELTNEQNTVTEFKNCGNYTLKLIENEITKNYKIDIKQEKYKIAKFDITLKPKDLEKNFNQIISISDFSLQSVTLAGEDKIENIALIEFEVYKENELCDYSKDLSVGTYDIKVKLTPKLLYDNYNITTANGILTIVERDTYIEASDIEKYYDGENVTFQAKLYGIDNEQIANANFVYSYFKDDVQVDEVKNVGNYQVKVVATSDENNKECQATFNIVIKTNVVSISLSNLSSMYNGQSYLPDYTYTMSSKVNLENILYYQLLDKNENNLNSVVNAGEYKVKFNLTDDNFALSQEVFTINITPIDVTIKIQDREITFKDDFEIENSTYTFESGNVLANESLDLTFSIEDYEDVVNSYVLTAENNNSNYNATVLDGKFIVNKRVINLQFTGQDYLVFDEQGQSNLLNVIVSNVVTDNAYSVYYLNSINQQIQNIYDAGEYSLKIEILDTQNYIFEDNTTVTIKQIIINKKQMTLNIDALDKVYDGNYINLNQVYCNDEIVPNSLYIIEYYNADMLISTPKNVGEYSVKITEKDANNYIFINNVKKFQITPRQVSVIEIENEYHYNRNDIKPQLTLTNVVENEDVKLDIVYISETGEFKNVGNYKIVINGLTGVDSINYTFVGEAEIDYQIIPTFIQVNIVNNKFTFTNKQVEKTSINMSFTGSIEVFDNDYHLSELPTNAGTHKILLTSVNTGIVFDISSFEVVIEKAQINEILFEDKTVIFDNNVHTIEVNTTKLSNGVEVNVEYTNNSFVDVGEYIVTATITNTNYVTKQFQATLKITTNVIDIQVSTENTFTFNQNPQGLEIIGLENLWYKDLIEFSYVGENYNSNTKPINAGKYKLVVTSKNQNNIKLNNQEFNFVINTKGITLQNVKALEKVYCADFVEYQVSFTGKYSSDEIFVNTLYDNKQDLPYNAKVYNVSFNGLIGKDANNYHLENGYVTTTLTINPYIINIVADNKSSVYGEEEKQLTYVSDKLLSDDKLSGQIAREQGKNANSYVISQGSLTAGDNYKINFVNGIYNITQRQLYFEDFVTQYTYNGQPQIPQVAFNNILPSDNNVIKVVTEGDTINAGNYKLQFVLVNTNYKLPEQKTFNITILKQDISQKIISLVTNQKDYDGNSFEPFVFIDGNFDYSLTYTINSNIVNEIKNAGIYLVKVELNHQNFKGEKYFEFVVNKIDYPKSQIEDIDVEISSDGFQVLGLNNISLSIDNENFVIGNKINGLNNNTIYTLFVKLHQSENYKETVFNIGEFKTSKSANELNEKVEAVLEKEISVEDIETIKQLLIDSENLSDIEKIILNDENLVILREKLEKYLETINEDITQTKSISDIVDFNSVKDILILPYFITFMGAGIIIFKGKKKNGR